MEPRVWLPTSLAEAWACKRTLGDSACYVAGSTWLQLRAASGDTVPSEWICVDEIADERDVPVEVDSTLHVGLRVTLAEVIRSSAVRRHWPHLHQVCRFVGAPALREQATVVGNLVAQGDLVPYLLVSGASLLSWNEGAIEEKSVSEWLTFRGATSDALVSRVKIPKELEHVRFFMRKVGRRAGFQPALVTIAASLENDDSGVIDDLRVAVGGGVHWPHRLPQVEALVRGERLRPSLLRELHRMIQSEMRTYDDAFATAEYRRVVVANLVTAFVASALEG
ncbi:FAD binding domain-containing protein [Alicyclobacillus fructus]|uniref:FAD binding domain-containing protein n=1 Tax=Alicyclobacillus fructus TaxID=2816082 RepID=UPI001F25BAA7|nr:FAD binding domain-containing protein [Alicyclobacillus fructus]